MLQDGLDIYFNVWRLLVTTVALGPFLWVRTAFWRQSKALILELVEGK